MWDYGNIEKEYHAKQKSKKKRLRVNRFGSVDFMRRHKTLYGKQRKRNIIAKSHRFQIFKKQIRNPFAGKIVKLPSDPAPQVQPEPVKVIAKNIHVDRAFSLRPEPPKE